MDVVDVIRTKRDGHRLSDEQITWFMNAYTAGDVADEQADIHGNTAKILEAIDAAAAPRRRSRRHSGDGAARLLHRRPGRGHGVPDGQRARAAGDRGGRAGHHGRRRLHRLRRRRARNDHGTIRKYNAAAVVRDGRVLQRARKSLLPELPLLRRQALSSRRASAASRSTSPGPAVRCRALGVSICEDLWDESYDVKPLPELAAQGGGSVLLNLNASPFYPGQAAHPRAADPPPHRSRCTARSSTSTPWAPPTTARTSSRSTARAWSTTPPGG